MASTSKAPKPTAFTKAVRPASRHAQAAAPVGRPEALAFKVPPPAVVPRRPPASAWCSRPPCRRDDPIRFPATTTWLLARELGRAPLDGGGGGPAGGRGGPPV